MILNFGHTFAHAIEAKNKFSKKINHGEAVLMGMILAAKLSYLKKITTKKNLTELVNATKVNLATYLEQFRMLTDAINIKNAFVVNISVDFKIRVTPGFNNQEILLNCLQAIKEFFNIDKWQIGQPIIKTEVFNVLTGITGVQSVQSVIFNNKSGLSIIELIVSVMA